MTTRGVSRETAAGRPGRRARSCSLRRGGVLEHEEPMARLATLSGPGREVGSVMQCAKTLTRCNNARCPAGWLEGCGLFGRPPLWPSEAQHAVVHTAFIVHDAGPSARHGRVFLFSMSYEMLIFPTSSYPIKHPLDLAACARDHLMVADCGPTALCTCGLWLSHARVA